MAGTVDTVAIGGFGTCTWFGAGATPGGGAGRISVT
jgi:hypothetical protein